MNVVAFLIQQKCVCVFEREREREKLHRLTDHIAFWTSGDKHMQYIHTAIQSNEKPDFFSSVSQMCVCLVPVCVCVFQKALSGNEQRTRTTSGH